MSTLSEQILALEPDSPGTFRSQAVLVRRQPADLEGSGPDSLAAILAQAAPEVDPERAVFWRNEVSNGTLDAYHTRMAASSLKNYAADADWQNRGGVPFMNSHRTGGGFFAPRPMELPLGRSLRGEYHAGRGGGLARTTADFYTVRGLKLGEVGTDDFIAGLESGIVRDTSISFVPGRYLCSICGEDMLRSETCSHWPGRTYEVEVDSGESRSSRAKAKKESRLCTADVEDAHMTESSAVWRGATPGAAVIKLFRAAESGRLPPREARLLEQTYRLAPHSVPSAARWAGFDPPRENPAETERQAAMSDTEQPEGTPNRESPPDSAESGGIPPESAQLGEIRSILAVASGLEAPVAPDEAAAAVRALVSERDGLRTERDRLREEARDVAEYRQEALERALVEGGRAMGDAFDRDLWQGMLATQPVRAILLAAASWQRQGDRVTNPAGAPPGRQTTDGDGSGGGGGARNGRRADSRRLPATANRT